MSHCSFVYSGISLMGTAGPMPTMTEKLCPRLSLKTFITFISVVQVIMVIITLIVAAVKFGRMSYVMHISLF
jgi:hypothetical protein